MSRRATPSDVLVLPRTMATKLLRGNDVLSAVCIPNVSVKLGPDRDIIFDRTGPVSSVMTPNSGDGFWREVFRSSGFYGLKANVIRREAT